MTLLNISAQCVLNYNFLHNVLVLISDSLSFVLDFLIKVQN